MSTRRSPLAIRGRDLQALAALAVICALVVSVVPWTPMRVIFAVPLCLVLPGYTLTLLAFAGTAGDRTRLLMLVPALSLCTLVLGSLILDVLPGGLRLGTWVALLLVVVLGECALISARRGPETPPIRLRWPTPRLRRSDRVLLLVGLLGAAAALTVSRIPMPAPNAIGYTQLWMLSNGSPQAPAVRIGVQSDERARTVYRVVLATGSGRSTVVYSHLVLSPGQRKEIDVSLTGLSSARSIVTAQLYRDGASRAYRQVTAILSAKRSSSAGS